MSEPSKILKAFKEIDADEDGLISKNEFDILFERFCHESGLDKDELFSAYDTDEDGLITFDEYKTLMTNSTSTIETLEEAFGLLDTDLDGYLSRDELLVLLQGVDSAATLEDVDEWLDDSDTDNDRKLNFAEFQALFKRTFGI